MTRRMIPVACTLPAHRAGTQLVGWEALLNEAISSEPISGGYAATFGIDVSEAVDRLVAIEVQCCDFLNIRTIREDATIRLEITADDTASQEIIRAMMTQ